MVTVYDEDGNEFALKLFDEQDEESSSEAEEEISDDEEDEEDSDEYDNGTDEHYDEEVDSEDDQEEEEEYEETFHQNTVTKPMELGCLREISILRILRHENAHPNVISIADVKQSNDITEALDGRGHASMQYPGIAMPLFRHGTLTDAIESKTLHKKHKVQIAHGILSAVAYLHKNGIIHRDLKTDNIMIHIDDNGNYNPVLIDFSLAKLIVPQQIYRFPCESDDAATKLNHRQKKVAKSQQTWNEYFQSLQGEDTHTPATGTPTYRSPESISNQPYGLPSDLYSVGIVLLELLRGSCIECFKDKGAAKIVESEVRDLPDRPFANLVRGLVEKDPDTRFDWKQALGHELFAKFGYAFNNNYGEHDHGMSSLRKLNLKEALPLEEEVDENNDEKTRAKSIQKRKELIKQIAEDLESENPLTIQAAYCYSTQLSQLDDELDSLEDSQGLIDCVVLAHKFFEKELWDLKAVEELDRGVFKKVSWSRKEYVDNEATIWLLMDFCLYPRELVEFGETNIGRR